jgi:F420-dependent oxidoreductase-like protein
MKIGIGINSRGVMETIALAQRVEQLGFHAAWMTSGGGGDPMPSLAAIAMKTSRIALGTSVVQTYPRHPLILAGEAYVLAQLAPGRFRLGVGPSHRPLMESLGLPFVAPLAHLEEYVRVLRSLFETGKVDFKGEHLRATSALPGPVEVPVMIGALRKNAFELSGRLCDGAITWLCPAPFVREVAIPEIRRAAEQAGRRAPPLIAHAAVCVTQDAVALRAAVRATIMNIRLPFYQHMLRDAGFPEAMEGKWSDRLIDAVIVWGDAEKVARRLEEFTAAGAAELLVRPIPLADDPDGSIDRTLQAIAPLSTR